MSSKKKYTVRINNESYCLIADEPEEHIMQVAQVLDATMSEIAHRSNQMADRLEPHKIAILAALQITSKLLMLEQQKDHYHAQYMKMVQVIDHQLSAI